jgi:para-nitrobenzyl esterase
MVWIHGGAYTMGSGRDYDGSVLARRGDVVVVTCNYRLGLFGWLPLAHLDPGFAGSANLGILDQMAALRWVRDNISAFGGDPGNVTIFGESAGAGSVFALLAAPDADGLYHRAIAQSGPPGFGPPREPATMAEKFARQLDADRPVLDVLLTASAEELVAAQSAVVGAGIEGLGTAEDRRLDETAAGFHPVVDGVVVTRRPAEALADKGGRNVPLIVGTNLDEGTLFAQYLSTPVTDEQAAAALGSSCPDPDLVVKTQRAAETGRLLLVDLFTYAVFRIPSLQAADAQANTDVPVWVYLFTWPTPILDGVLGATHALEIPFVWNLLDDPLWRLFVGDDAPRELAEAMQDAWIAFARSGDPNHDRLPGWRPYDTNRRPTMEFGSTTRLVDDPEAELRRAWYGE